MESEFFFIGKRHDETAGCKTDGTEKLKSGQTVSGQAVETAMKENGRRAGSTIRLAAFGASRVPEDERLFDWVETDAGLFAVIGIPYRGRS